jgi:Carboxypeptidase regulatory-like domain
MFTSNQRCSGLLIGMLIILVIAIVLSKPAAAQTITGSIAGTVTDSSNRLIVGATVTLLGEQTGSKRDLITSEEGRFGFSAVQPGVYTLKVEQRGFQTLERKGVVLSANENLAL